MDIGLQVVLGNLFIPKLIGPIGVVSCFGIILEHAFVVHQVFVGSNTPAESCAHGLFNLLGIKVPPNKVELAECFAAELPSAFVDDSIEEIGL